MLWVCCFGPANPEKVEETLLVRLTAEILEAQEQWHGWEQVEMLADTLAWTSSQDLLLAATWPHCWDSTVQGPKNRTGWRRPYQGKVVGREGHAFLSLWDSGLWEWNPTGCWAAAPAGGLTGLCGCWGRNGMWHWRLEDSYGFLLGGSTSTTFSISHVASSWDCSACCLVMVVSVLSLLPLQGFFSLCVCWTESCP